MKPFEKKILVADDDSAIVEALTLMLEDAQYQVIATTDGNSVPDLLAEKPDLLLLDIWMSGIDGRTICAKLKADEKTKDIPIIMISANKDTQGIAKEAGANDFLTKPFQMDDLLEKVAKYLG